MISSTCVHLENYNTLSGFKFYRLKGILRYKRQKRLQFLDYAVGLPTSEQAESVFVDSYGDYVDIFCTNTNYADGAAITDISLETVISLKGGQIVDVNNSYSRFVDQR